MALAGIPSPTNLTAFTPPISTSPGQLGQAGSTPAGLGQGTAQNLLPIIQELLQIIMQLLGALGGGQGMPGTGGTPAGGGNPTTGGAPASPAAPGGPAGPTGPQNGTPAHAANGAPAGPTAHSAPASTGTHKRDHGSPTSGCKGDKDHDGCRKHGTHHGGGTGSNQPMADLQKVIEDLGQLIKDLGQRL